ncbi:hypothetical protein EPR50_G00200340 [Perca flavescens]|uniref:U2A'/phosphoprotein 32 family A C-terminal domain-containing protein n=1 Tax=Perca flavescens TaxID=8167 RepID=A0A484C7S8_PERFV|nr:hypothetical protein EPR50_G00200340 [Perca flavescens]
MRSLRCSLSTSSPYWNPALLGQLEKLSTLILDCNNYTSHIKFPYMPSVTTVCINKNKINNLPVFVEEIRRKFPNIKILSMMNNEAAPSYFNGGSLTQYKDYRQYVISQIPGLEILDDTECLWAGITGVIFGAPLGRDRVKQKAPVNAVSISCFIFGL